MSKILESTILAEEITSHFEDQLGGVYSDLAWYELLDYCWRYKTKEARENSFINHLDFVFGFNGKRDFDVVQHKADKRYKKLEKELYGK